MNTVGARAARSATKVSSASGEEDVAAFDHRRAFDPARSNTHGQRQVGQDADFSGGADGAANIADDAFGRAGDAVEAVHHALRRPVEPEVYISSAMSSPARPGCPASGSVAKPPNPSVHARLRRVRASGEGDAGQVFAHGAGLLRPGVEFADEQHAGAAVVQHVADGIGGFGREDRHRGAADIQMASSAMKKCAQFFEQDRDARPGSKLRLLMKVAAIRRAWIHRLPPGVVRHRAATGQLRQPQVIGRIASCA